jgi:hypothetical protein
MEISKVEFRGAGCMFTNGRTVLGAYQSKRGIITISGLGGNRNECETFMVTALRETLEELLDVQEVPPGLIQRLEKELRPTSIRGKYVDGWGIYVVVIYTFEDLLKILKRAEEASVKSPLYTKFPRTLSTLLLDRDPAMNPNTEITYLTILPVGTPYSHTPIHQDLVEDMDSLKFKYCV